MKSPIRFGIKNESDFLGENFKIPYRITCIKWEVTPKDFYGGIFKSPIELGVKNENDFLGEIFKSPIEVCL